ncbi:MAG: cbb3-type cytochrome c oxidase subunit 3 [Ignavibacteriaceae bacterium]
MYRQILESIDGVGIYPVITLIIFFLFFVIMIVWLIKADKNYLKRMAQLPLDHNDSNKNYTGEL